MRHFRLCIIVLVSTTVFANGQLSHFLATDGTVQAKGKWKLVSGQKEDEPPAELTVEIDCSRHTRICTEAQAKIVAGKPDVDIFYYDVSIWDQNGVSARETEPICVTSQLSINFQSQSVTVIDEPKEGAVGYKGACKLMNHTRIYRLVNRPGF